MAGGFDLCLVSGLKVCCVVVAPMRYDVHCSVVVRVAVSRVLSAFGKGQAIDSMSMGCLRGLKEPF